MTELVLVLTAVGVVWALAYLARGSLIAGCLAFLLAGYCFGFPFLSFDLGPIPLTIDRLVMVGLVIAYGVQWRLGRTDPKPLCVADWLAFATLGALALSTFTHDFTRSLPGDAPPTYRLLGGYVMPMALYWIGRQSRLNERNVTVIHAALVGFGVYLAATAFLEVAQQWSLVFPKYIADPEVGIHFGRARGPMVQSVSLGLTLAVCLLAALCLWPRVGRAAQAVLALLVPVFLLAIYFTLTRSVWMGTGLGVVTVLALLLPAVWRKPFLATVAVAGLVFAATSFDKVLSFQREFSAENTRESAELRKSFAYVSWQMFLDRPLWGVGFGRFPEEKIPYIDDRTTEIPLQPIRDWVHHNTLLSLLTEVGLIGLGLFLATLAALCVAAWRLYRSPEAPYWARAHGALTLGVLGAYLCQTAFHEVSYTPLDNSLVFFLSGVAVGLCPQRQPAATPAPARSFPSRQSAATA